MFRKLLITLIPVTALAGCGNIEDQAIPGTAAEARAIGSKLSARTSPGNGDPDIGRKFAFWWDQHHAFIKGRGRDPCDCGAEPRTVGEALAEIDRLREIGLARENEFNRRVQAGELGAMADEDEARSREAARVREANDPAYQAVIADQERQHSAEQADLARQRAQRMAEERATEERNQEDIARAAAANADEQRRINDSIRRGREPTR